MRMALLTKVRVLCRLYYRTLSTVPPTNDSSTTTSAPSRHHTPASELSFIYQHKPSSSAKHLFGTKPQDASEQYDSFSDFTGLNPILLKHLERAGFSKPMEIQKQSLSAALQGKHVVIKSITGSGKTLAFLIPALNKIITTEPHRKPQIVIVAPTRELCTQIVGQIDLLIGSDRVQNFIGGNEKVRKQGRMFKGDHAKKDIIVATPGRIVQSVAMNILQPQDIKSLILDEADQLLDEMFYSKIRWILDNSNAKKQIMVTTATIPPEVQFIIDRYMKCHEYIDTGDSIYTLPSAISHKAIIYNKKCKTDCLKWVLKKYHKTSTMLFLKYGDDCEDVASMVRLLGYKTSYIYSVMPQNNRVIVMDKFKAGLIEVLVTTDISARGVDVPQCELVIQFCPVTDVDKFVHRSGRTGRAGRPGTSVLMLPNLGNTKKFRGTDDKFMLFLEDLSKIVKFEYIHFDKTFIKKMGVKP